MIIFITLIRSSASQFGLKRAFACPYPPAVASTKRKGSRLGMFGFNRCLAAGPAKPGRVAKIWRPFFFAINLAAISVAPIWPAGRSKMNCCTRICSGYLGQAKSRQQSKCSLFPGSTAKMACNQTAPGLLTWWATGRALSSRLRGCALNRPTHLPVTSTAVHNVRPSLNNSIDHYLPVTKTLLVCSIPSEFPSSSLLSPFQKSQTHSVAVRRWHCAT